MKVIIVVGKAGSGKTPIIQSIISGRDCFVFDINNEYGSRTKYAGAVPVLLSDNINDNRSRHIEGDFDKFLLQCQKKRKTIVVFEDATGFVEGRLSASLRKTLVNKLFTLNIYVLVFHSISAIPPRIMQLSDIVILLPTNDEEYVVQKKYPRLLKHFRRIRKKEIKKATIKLT